MKELACNIAFEIITTGKRERMLDLWNAVSGYAAVVSDTYTRNLQGYNGIEFDDLFSSTYIALDECLKTFQYKDGLTEEENNRRFFHWFKLYIQKEFQRAAGYVNGRFKQRTISLNAPAFSEDDSEAEIGDILPVKDEKLDEIEEAYRQRALKKALDDALQAIPARESYIIRRHYLDNVKQKEIAKEMSYTNQNVNLLLKQGIRKIRKNINITPYGKELVELYYNIPWSTPVSSSVFWRDHTSGVEKAVLRRDDLQKKLMRFVFDDLELSPKERAQILKQFSA